MKSLIKKNEKWFDRNANAEFKGKVKKDLAVGDIVESVENGKTFISEIKEMKENNGYFSVVEIVREV